MPWSQPVIVQLVTVAAMGPPSEKTPTPCVFDAPEPLRQALLTLNVSDERSASPNLRPASDAGSSAGEATGAPLRASVVGVFAADSDVL